MKCRLPHRRDFPSGAQTCTVTLRSFYSANAAYCSVTVGGTTYASSQTLEIPVGTEIGLTVGTNGTTVGVRKMCSITLPDGSTVTGPQTYNYIVMTDIRVTASVLESGSYTYGTLDVTEVT